MFGFSCLERRDDRPVGAFAALGGLGAEGDRHGLTGGGSGTATAAEAGAELEALSLLEEQAVSTSAAAIAVAAIALRSAVRGDWFMSWPSLS